MNSKKICGIVGFPLNQPRSISIWKKFFKKKKVKVSMNKFEVSKNKLKNFVEFMKSNEDFLATAITMPYKISLFKKVKVEDEFARYSESINLINKYKNKLYGYNTDIYGALYSIKNKIKFYDEFLIIGLGGTGRALFNYLSKKYRNKNFNLITNKRIKEKKNIRIFKKIKKKNLTNQQLIINCTPLGSNLKKNYLDKTPIPINLVRHINKKSFVFDVVYAPKKTLLNKYCKKYSLNYTNGLLMNTVQAERALNIVFKNLKNER